MAQCHNELGIIILLTPLQNSRQIQDIIGRSSSQLNRLLIGLGDNDLPTL